MKYLAIFTGLLLLCIGTYAARVAYFRGDFDDATHVIPHALGIIAGAVLLLTGLSMPTNRKPKKLFATIYCCDADTVAALTKGGVPPNMLSCPVEGINSIIEDMPEECELVVFNGNQRANGNISLDELTKAQNLSNKGANVVVRFDPASFDENSSDRADLVNEFIKHHGLRDMTTEQLATYIKKRING